jgi:hypothetical protein
LAFAGYATRGHPVIHGEILNEVNRLAGSGHRNFNQVKADTMNGSRVAAIPNGGKEEGLHEELAAHEVRSHLARIFASPAFRASKRCHRFLEYVVMQTLDGKASILKERTLAVEVFDRSTSWDSSDDTIVRVGAREVRKRLAQFYTSPEGAAERIRIELHSGSYVPEFSHIEVGAGLLETGSKSPEAAAGSVLTSLVPDRQAHQRRTRVLGPASALVLCAVLLGIALVLGAKQSRFDQFWAPFWKAPDPVLVAIANPLVYHPSDRATRLNNAQLGANPTLRQRALQLPPDDLNGSDMIPVTDQYVGFGDAAVATQVSALLASHAKETRLRLGSKVDFDDFRESSAVLIGAFTNQWTVEFTHKLRFHFGYDAHGSFAILDAAHPGNGWSIPEKKADGSSPEDYILVCRLANSPSGKPMIIAGGITMFGTEAAGHFLTAPDRMNEALRRIGQNWQNRNVEIVFHAKVIDNSPSASEVVAAYVW